jgi:hypothetical protein
MVGPAWTVRSALAGWTRENAATAAKMSKSLGEDFMHDGSSIDYAGFTSMLHVLEG